ncbi:CAF17-like 4Fe-4S cluster assembly/insertion protein YgfZ [Rhodopila globiformis]|uniref:Folate-binding protein YgfZ n=1 Tax=Rhodopila globiformis TaxID=1071 RepID=A0A2S6N615_RHOGL|nr:folate-binding protein YgfZ [Rhodopila globiformis]PPQ30065.1 folate-binding protein YgfZ [Rhodopila globiformis]
MNWLTLLPDRGVIILEGDDRVAFLQGLVSNDVETAAPGRAVWAALLTPQGKWLADFFIFADADRLLLECERGQMPMLLQRLGRFRLRMKVTLREEPALHVHVAWPRQPAVPGIIAPDPRLPDFAWRILAAEPLDANATPEGWDRHRLDAGLPDGSKDLEAEHSVLLEAGFDELGGVSWSKGCYMGQELTARTRYRGLVKRRLVPVLVDGPLPAPGSAIFQETREVGVMRSGRDHAGMALLRLDALARPLRCGETILTPRVPPWMRLPEPAATGG